VAKYYATAYKNILLLHSLEEHCIYRNFILAGHAGVGVEETGRGA